MRYCETYLKYRARVRKEYPPRSVCGRSLRNTEVTCRFHTCPSARPPVGSGRACRLCGAPGSPGRRGHVLWEPAVGETSPATWLVVIAGWVSAAFTGGLNYHLPLYTSRAQLITRAYVDTYCWHVLVNNGWPWKHQLCMGPLCHICNITHLARATPLIKFIEISVEMNTL